MPLSHEDFQKARRISRVIQQYLEMLNQDGLRSTDLYEHLVKKNLIEKDKQRGIHFRRFLHKLKDQNLLSLIPQFTYRTNSTKFLEWYFYRVSEEKMPITSKNSDNSAKLITPELPEKEINELIQKASSHIDKLPKRDENNFSYTQLETRKLYPRAYEKWSKRELEIMIRAYNKFKRIDKVAELLQRQPSALEKRLKEHIKQ